MAIDAATRAATLFVWARKCFYCGREAECVDHVVPVKKGGADSPLNLVASCWGCNRTKDDLWLPLDVMTEALEAAKTLEPSVVHLAMIYKSSLQVAADRMNYGSAPLREGNPGRAWNYRGVRHTQPARVLAAEAAAIARQFGVLKPGRTGEE